MKKVNKGILSFLASTLLVGSLAFSKPKVVSMGEAEFSNHSLITSGLVGCTAIAFDYGKTAVMAHALPLLESQIDYPGKRLLNSREVVDYLIKESLKRGLNPKEAQVYINSGSKSSLDKIINDLDANHLFIVSQELAPLNPEGKQRTVIYNPIRNQMSVKY